MLTLVMTFCHLPKVENARTCGAAPFRFQQVSRNTELVLHCPGIMGKKQTKNQSDPAKAPPQGSHAAGYGAFPGKWRCQASISKLRRECCLVWLACRALCPSLRLRHAFPPIRDLPLSTRQSKCTTKRQPSAMRVTVTSRESDISRGSNSDEHDSDSENHSDSSASAMKEAIKGLTGAMGKLNPSFDTCQTCSGSREGRGCLL